MTRRPVSWTRYAAIGVFIAAIAAAVIVVTSGTKPATRSNTT